MMKEAGAYLLLVSLISGAGSDATPDHHSASTTKTSSPVTVGATQSSDVDLLIEPTLLDLGRIPSDSHVKSDFKITNKTSEPLFILAVESSCGCTVTDIENKRLSPGASTKVSIDVDTSAKKGPFKKTIKIMAATGKSFDVVLKGEAVPSPHSQKGEGQSGPGKGIFDGKCRQCHYDPAIGEHDGKKLFANICSMCHGVSAEGGYAPSLKGLPSDLIYKAAAFGVGNNSMPGFLKSKGGPLTEEQLHSIVEWIKSQDPGK